MIVLTGSLPVPDWARQGAVISGVLFGGALIVMLIMVWQRRLVLRLAEAVLSKIPRLNTQKWVGVVGHVLDGFAVRQPGLPLVMVLFWSIVVWLCSALSFYLSLKAFVPDAPYTYALFTTVVTTFVRCSWPLRQAQLARCSWVSKSRWRCLAYPQAVGLSFAIAFHVMELIVMNVLGVICLLHEAGSWAKAKESLRWAHFISDHQVDAVPEIRENRDARILDLFGHEEQAKFPFQIFLFHKIY